MSICSAVLSDQEMHGTKPLAVTVATARKLSGLGNTTIWARIKDRTLETVCVGRRRLILYRSLERLLSPELPHAAPQPRRRGRPRKARVSEAAA